MFTHQAAAPFADILTSGDTGLDLGRRLGGLRPGPALLVATGPGLLKPLHRRLSALPSLQWMRGSLILIRLTDISADLSDYPIDDTLTLPQIALNAEATRAAYWTILRKATAMGMIDGRGVPAVAAG